MTHTLYVVLSFDNPIHELGEDFLDKLEPERERRNITRKDWKRLEELGYHVVVTKKIT